MSLLTQQTTQAPGQYYFATRQAGGLSESSYTATGITGDVDYVAQRVQDTGGGTDLALLIQNNALLSRWGVGLVNVEGAGVDDGSDWTIVRYNDAGTGLVAAQQISRSDGSLTEVGQITSVQRLDNANVVNLNTGYTSATQGSAQVRMTARSGAGTTQSEFTTCDGGSGFTTVAVQDPTGTVAAAYSINNDAAKNPSRALGQVNFVSAPLAGGAPIVIPIVSQQNMTNMVGPSNQTIVVPVSASDVARPFIQLTWTRSGIQDDSGNALTQSCSVQSDNAVGPAIIGTQINSFPSGGDYVTGSSSVVLTRGTNYNASTTSLLFVFTNVNANFKAGRFTLTGFAI